MNKILLLGFLLIGVFIFTISGRPHAEQNNRLLNGSNEESKIDSEFPYSKSRLEILIIYLLSISGRDNKHTAQRPEMMTVISRKKFFSTSGWDDYTTYMNQEKKILSTMNSSASLSPEFIDGSTEISKDSNNDIIFKSKAKVCYAATDLLECDNQVLQIRVLFSESGTIDQWSVERKIRDTIQ